MSDAAELLKRYTARRAGLATEGDVVSWDGGSGVVEYVMFDGTLGEYSGKFALEAEDDDPVALVSVFRNGSPTGYMVGKMLSDLTVTSRKNAATNPGNGD